MSSRAHRSGFLLLVAGLLATVAPAVARAETGRPSMPAQVGSAHILLHYDPATASAEYAAAGLADFEEAYSRLVAGAGGTPNAGLRQPVADGSRGGDARTDVYLSAPPWRPDYVGGQAVEDDATYPDIHVDSGFIYMTPSLARVAFRFRSAHELMHVIQDAYVVTSGLFTESTANWAADTALPDIDPRDSQFPQPFVPLNCSYLSWEGTECGNGYRQWLFIAYLTERYGLGFVDRLWLQHRTDCLCEGTVPNTDRLILEHAITAEPGDATLATAYADYAAALWDPTRWATSAVDTLHREDGPPLTTDANLSRSTPVASGSASVDHLATRYIRIRHGAASSPGDQVHITVTAAAGAAPPLLLAATGPGRARSVTPLPLAAPNTYDATVSLDGANLPDTVLLLTNASGTIDDLPFTWRADLHPAGPATPPAGDDRASPQRIQPRTTTVVDTAYAGGLGSLEAPDCATTAAATRGVWFTVLVDKGQLTVDPRGSDYEAATAIYDITNPGAPYLAGCSEPGTNGYVTRETFAREYLIYVGRANTAGGPGHTLRVAVDGTPNSFGTETEDRAAPLIISASLSPTRFRAAKSGGPLATKLPTKRGATLAFTLTERASIRLVFERRSTGRLVGGKCVKATTKNRAKRRCTRYTASGGTGREAVPAGNVRLLLTGRRTTRKALATGAYRLRLTATDAAGNTSPRTDLPFTIRR